MALLAHDPACYSLARFLENFHVIVNDAGEVVGMRVTELKDGKHIDRLLSKETHATLVEALKITLEYWEQA